MEDINTIPTLTNQINNLVLEINPHVTRKCSDEQNAKAEIADFCRRSMAVLQ